MLRYPYGNQALRYPGCTMTATVYHVNYNPFSCRRAVLQGVYFEQRHHANVNKAGQIGSNGYLLIIPQKAGIRVAPATDTGIAGMYVLAAGDRVLPGTGPLIATREEWSRLVPANYPEVVTLGWVEQKYLHGLPCHVEAGS